MSVIAMMLALAAPVIPPRSTSPPPVASFVDRLLRRQNAARAAVHVPPMTWNAQLAIDAGRWAQHLAASHSFEHALEPPSGPSEGENLWMGTAKAYSLEEMVAGWIDEQQMYRPGLFPNITTTRHWEDVGHYTQVIWGNTKQVGCALATGAGDDFLVCRYSPPGNWDGEMPTAVAK